MSGYWGDEQSTRAALVGGWLMTGDLGAIDEDGLLTLKGRAKELIISGGSNIYPREVEEVLLRHPAVAEVAVVGTPDPVWGEKIVAFVVARTGSQVTASELDTHCLHWQQNDSAANADLCPAPGERYFRGGARSTPRNSNGAALAFFQLSSVLGWKTITSSALSLISLIVAPP